MLLHLLCRFYCLSPGWLSAHHVEQSLAPRSVRILSGVASLYSQFFALLCLQV